MKYFYSFLCVCLFFATTLISGIFTFPLFSSNRALTSQQHTLINSQNETELEVLSHTFSPAVLSLDWFSAVNNIFEKFNDTEVIDINTKTKFIVQRTGGINHADVEVKDKENLLKLLNIFNNSLSIKPRPVLVNINNMWIAASLNATPRGYSLISDNEQNGHLCLHFQSSKTHGTNRVDALHQKNIKFALKNFKSVWDML